MKVSQSYFLQNYTKNESEAFNEGDILEGVIQSSEENVYVKLENGKTLKFSSSEIVGKEGDNVTFEVLKSSANTISLAQKNTELLNNNFSTSEKNYIINDISITNSEKNINSYSSSYIKTLQKTQGNTYTSNISIKKTLESVSHINNALGEIALEYLNETGINIEKIDVTETSSILEKVLIEDTSEESLEEIEITEDIEKLGISEEEFYRYAAILSKFNLPITPENIMTLRKVENKINGISNLNESSTLSLLKNESVTFNAIYISKYTTTTQLNNKENSSIEIENIEQLLKDLFKEQEITLNEENLKLAKIFIANEIDISKETFEKYNIISNIENFINKDKILEDTAISIIKNQKIDSIVILENKNLDDKLKLSDFYQNVKQILPHVTAEHLQLLIDNNLPINIQNIVNQYNKDNLEQVKDISLEAISERLNIAKIQMKLTQEAIFRLSSSGIDISTDSLQETISLLESIETDIYKENLETVGVENTDSNLNVMKTALTSIKNIYPSNFYTVIPQIINSEIEFSINDINAEILNVNNKKIFEALEIFKTEVNPALGDKFSQLNEQFETMLNENDIEVNECNLKAAKILSLNQIDFSEENLTKVKVIDNKINYIHDKLHPLFIAKLIKEGIDPSVENIDNLITLIDDASDAYSQTSREKIAEYILDMQKNENISETEKNAIVAFYRMINIIEKNGSASIGTLLKNKNKVTLQDLMQASSIYQKQKRNINFDRKIDNSFGDIEELIIPENNIKNSIQNAINHKNEYNNILTKRIIDYAKPESINKILNMENHNEMSLELILEEVKNSELSNIFISKQTANNMLTKLKNVTINDKASLSWLIENNIPITISNIENMKEVIKNNFDISENISNLNKTLKENGILPIEIRNSIISEYVQKPDDIEEVIEKVQQDSQENFDEILNINSFSTVSSVLSQSKLLHEKLSFTKSINKIDNGVYKMPIKLQSGEITDLNMYILNHENINTKDELNLHLSLKTKNLGNVQCFISIHNNQINININSDIIKGLEKLEKYNLDFSNSLKEYFESVNIIFEQSEASNTFSDNFKEDFKSKIEDISNQLNIIV